MNKIFKFGEEVDGYNIPVLNEREIRAASGLLFLMMYTTINIIGSTNNFVPFKYGVVFFFTDFFIRVFISPRFSPSLILGRLIVRKQVPEYVGAAQKKFAWTIGFVLALIIVSLMLVVNAYSPITGIICLICLIFLFFESAFGICFGCMFYNLFYKEKAQHCPGEVCELKDRQDIQKTSLPQIMVVIGFIAYMFAISFLFHDFLSKTPHPLFGKGHDSQAQVDTPKPPQ
ncbi:MAG: DUF4395 domain-containing protein [Deltaproteobacteria bacterium]|nr:DUF4395 domain-containing protein [Deltaproteobacteria bacterium]